VRKEKQTKMMRIRSRARSPRMLTLEETTKESVALRDAIMARQMVLTR
jgi:hypothetical protein